MGTQLEQTRHKDKDYSSKTQHKDRVKDAKRTNLAQEENTKHTIARHDQVPGSWRHKRQRERINRDMTEDTDK